MEEELKDIMERVTQHLWFIGKQEEVRIINTMIAYLIYKEIRTKSALDKAVEDCAPF